MSVCPVEVGMPGRPVVSPGMGNNRKSYQWAAEAWYSKNPKINVAVIEGE